MHLIAPDLMADARQLSVTVSAAGLLLGLALWLFGWRGHRFWIVLTTTLGGGVYGLSQSPSSGAQPLVAGLLAAVAAGVLALSLVRLIAFAVGALAACVVVGAAAPAWDQPLVTALAGGLLGVALFRLWTMIVTSAAGTVLIAYCGLSLLDRLGTLDSVAWAGEQTVLLDGAGAALALAGVLAQYLMERRRHLKERQAAESAAAKAAEEEEDKRRKPEPPPPKPSLWESILTGLRLRAG